MNGATKRILKGYTLIEMAMVLVIAGIALGAVLQGRELIENAKIKSTISDFENISQAYFAYLKRVGTLPGLPKDSLGNVTSVGLTGDFFKDLMAEGFLDGTDVSSSGRVKHAYGSYWVFNLNSDIGIFDAPQLCVNKVPLFVAKALDERMDDGNPSTGRVMTRHVTRGTLVEYIPADDYEANNYRTCRIL